METCSDSSCTCSSLHYSNVIIQPCNRSRPGKSHGSLGPNRRLRHIWIQCDGQLTHQRHRALNVPEKENPLQQVHCRQRIRVHRVGVLICPIAPHGLIWDWDTGIETYHIFSSNQSSVLVRSRLLLQTTPARVSLDRKVASGTDITAGLMTTPLEQFSFVHGERG